MIELGNEKLTLVRHNIAFSAAAHCREIRQHPAFSPSTKDKLCGFFE